jgi:O-antigen ligase
LAVVVTVAAIPSLRRGLALVVPAIGMALVPLLLFTRFGHQVLDQVRLHSSASTSGSNSARSDLADLAIKQIQARPIQGVGFGVIEDAHSIYLQILAAGGVIGLGAFLTFVGGLWGATRRALDSPQRDAAAASAIAVLMWLANGIFDSQLADKYLYVVPGLLVAMSCVASATTRVPALAPPAATAAGPPKPSLAGAV